MKQKLICQIAPKMVVKLPVPTFEEIVTADQKIIHTAHTLEGLAALLASEKETARKSGKLVVLFR